jgi:hypothetical protein
MEHLDHFNSSLSGLSPFGQIDVESPTTAEHFSQVNFPNERLWNDLTRLSRFASGKYDRARASSRERRQENREFCAERIYP